MRRILGSIAITTLALGAAAACGTEPEQATRPTAPVSRPDGASSGPNTPDQASTTTQPKRQVRGTPECVAYSQYSLGQTAMSFATPEQLLTVQPAFEKVSESIKVTLPQFATQFDRIRELTIKNATGGGLDDAETAELSAVFEPLTAWYTETCIIEPGEEE